MATKSILEYISKKERDAVPAEDFAGPHSSFPIRNQEDVHNAARLIGHAENPDAVKAAIIRIAKRKGLSIPDAWQTSDKPKESVSSPSTTFTPKSRVATFKTKFLTDDAQSRNRRRYPQEAVDRLVHSGQLQLETPGSDPLTCYISHGEADNDNSLKLAGKITKVWKSGQDAWANIEMPDTTTGREAATLAKHGFLKTSLRATGAELRLSKSGGLPEVSGEGLRLLGIDFTTTPGIETVTVEDVTLESSSQSPQQSQDINEIFELPTESLLLEEVVEEDPNAEEASSDAHNLMIASKNDVQAIHDHIATAQGRSCAPSSMEHQEAGRKFSASTQTQLNAAHDKAAEVLGLECGGSDNMDDGDDDDSSDQVQPRPQENLTQENINPELENNQTLEVPQEEEETMTPEEMIQALKEAGFSVEPPKTAEEKLQEALDAKFAAMQEAFDNKLTEATNKFATANVTKGQRTSLVEGNNVNNNDSNQTNNKIYRKGSYLQEQLKGQDWNQLADRTQPLPDGINPAYLLQEFGHMYLLKSGYYDEA